MKNDKIGLALSGGGFRAAIFHLGVLRWLAENKKLEMIAHISSVSGGTLLVGLIYHLNGNRWPSSQEFLETIYPNVRAMLTKNCLRSSLLINTFKLSNWKLVFSVSNILAKTIESSWGVTAILSELEPTPIWTINGTTAENGRRFRFKQNQCGDYELGYAAASNFKLAEAMSISAAFPALIGPFKLNVTRYSWFKRKNWGDPPEGAERVSLPYSFLHIYDGGIYDNLGLEPFFDAGAQRLKDQSIAQLIVSDAGASLKRGNISGRFNPFRLKRLFDIVMDQSHALRIRSLINYLSGAENRGYYLQIGCDPTYSVNITSIALEQKTKILSYGWLDKAAITKAKSFPTGISKVSQETFDLIALHGYETIKFNSLLHH